MNERDEQQEAMRAAAAAQYRTQMRAPVWCTNTEGGELRLVHRWYGFQAANMLFSVVAATAEGEKSDTLVVAYLGAARALINGETRIAAGHIEVIVEEIVKRADRPIEGVEYARLWSTSHHIVEAMVEMLRGGVAFAEQLAPRETLASLGLDTSEGAIG